MKKIGKLLVATVLMGTMVLGAGCGGGKANAPAKTDQPAPAPAAQKADKTYIVGTNPTFAPFEMQDKDGKMTGFDLDLIKAIAADQGIKVEIKSMEFDGLIMALQNGTIDIVISGMTIDEERAKQVSFSDGYKEAGLAVAVKADNKAITGLNETLKGKVVASQTGTTGAAECTKQKEKGIVSDAKLLQDINLCMLDLESGGTDAVIYDVPVLEAYMKANPGKIQIVGDAFANCQFGIAVQKDNKELVDKLNAGLKNLRANGKYDEISAKYFAK